MMVAALHDVQDAMESAKEARGHYPQLTVSSGGAATLLSDMGVRLPERVSVESYFTSGRGRAETYSVCLTREDGHWAAVAGNASGTTYGESPGGHCPRSPTWWKRVP
jgi:hypothetical protein